jgi:hypothetical protein
MWHPVAPGLGITGPKRVDFRPVIEATIAGVRSNKRSQKSYVIPLGFGVAASAGVFSGTAKLVQSDDTRGCEAVEISSG